jgi:hypothetical protein
MSRKRVVVETPPGWNKKYFNVDDRQIAVIVGALIIKCEEYAEQWEKAKRPKEMIRMLRMSAAFADRFLRMMLSSLDKDERVRVCNDLDRYQIYAAYKQQAQMALDKLREDNANVVVNREDLQDLMESVAEANCTGCTTDHTTCALHKIYTRYGLPYYDDTADGCPYRV